MKKNTTNKGEPADGILQESGDTSRIPFPIIRALVEMYYDFQDQRITSGNRIDGNVRQGLILEDHLTRYGVNDVLTAASSFEKGIQKRLTTEIKSYPLYNDYFEKIYGIGVILSAGLMAYIEDVGKFKNISSLWQYAGVGMNTFCEKCNKPSYVEVIYGEGKTRKVAKRLRPMKQCQFCGGTTVPIRQRRTIGYQSNYNDKMKVLCWKIATSFVKQSAKKSGYRRIYDQIKADEHVKHPSKIIIDGKQSQNDGHLHNKAMRKTVKIFLSHVWTTWRRMENLEVTKPYESQVLNHSIIEPFTDK